MNETITVNEFDSKENFEFRYPKKPTAEMKQGFVRFVNWMATSNPGAANKNHILTAELADVTSATYEPNSYFIYNV
jgi:hypothetical protein